MIGMILDVGVGFRPLGNVNVDLFDPRFAGEGSFKRDPRSIKNCVMADGQYLPFRSNVFEKVYSKGVIEHTAKPLLFFKEMIRTSKNRIVLICPHRYHKDFPFHITYFNVRWFERILNRWFFTGKISRFEIDLSYSSWPHRYLQIIRRPFLITVQIWLKGYGRFIPRLLNSK